MFNRFYPIKEAHVSSIDPSGLALYRTHAEHGPDFRCSSLNCHEASEELWEPGRARETFQEWRTEVIATHRDLERMRAARTRPAA
jgi:hypothetical protein